MNDTQPTTIDDRITTILCDELGLDTDEVTPNADIRLDLGADSLDIAEVVMRCEEEFGFELPGDFDDDTIVTVGDLIKLVTKNTK